MEWQSDSESDEREKSRSRRSDFTAMLLTASALRNPSLKECEIQNGTDYTVYYKLRYICLRRAECRTTSVVILRLNECLNENLIVAKIESANKLLAIESEQGELRLETGCFDNCQPVCFRIRLKIGTYWA